MKELKFTPGPWKVKNGWNEFGQGKYFPSVVLAPEKDDMGRGSIVVNISHDQEVESIMANAKLISKAPDMYSALLKVKSVFNIMLGPAVVSGISDHDLEKKIEQVLSEINKILEE